MHTIESLIDELPPRPCASELVRRFTPPPRFEAKRFAEYRPDPEYPSQTRACGSLQGLARELRSRESAGLLHRIRTALRRKRPRGSGVYLDGGFGVGKTHLLAALWNAAPGPKSYLSFDELVYTIGLLGVDGARAAFSRHVLVTVDEWELDDPGNLRMALAFLRGAVADGVHIATTSNTVPDQLGRGRFAQKDFAAEIEELAGVFTVLSIEGEDYRRRRFEASPGRGYFVAGEALDEIAADAEGRVLRTGFASLLAGLEAVHPIRYTAIIERIDVLAVDGLGPLDSLPRALRWAHFVDKLYDAAVPLAASAEAPLVEHFPPAYLRGAYGKKFSRTLSRLEEMLGEGVVTRIRSPA